MRKKSIYRGILIVAGILSAAIIILSHSIEFKEIKKAKTEHSEEKADSNTILKAPSEVVSQVSVVSIDEQVPDALLETLTLTEISRKFIPDQGITLSKFFQVLFKLVIAPNAP
jgi:hypothetical protein